MTDEALCISICSFMFVVCVCMCVYCVCVDECFTSFFVSKIYSLFIFCYIIRAGGTS